MIHPHSWIADRRLGSRRRTLQLILGEDELLDASEDLDQLLTALPEDASPAFRNLLLTLDDAISDALSEM